MGLFSTLLLLVSCALLCASALEAGQQQALEKIYEDCGGAKWVKSGGWLQNEDGCTWEGVTCNFEDQVKLLQLPGNNLVGALPSAIGDLGLSIEELDLGENKLTSVPAELAALKSLRVLILDSNPMPIMDDAVFQGLTALQDLDIDNTGVRALPLLGNRMRTISAKNNNINSIRAGHANMPDLQTLVIEHNEIATIDPLVGLNWASLEDLDLDNNRLQALPLFTSPLLRRISVFNNQLTALPAFDAQHLALREVLASNNRITTPPDYSACPRLAILRLDGNPNLATLAPATAAGYPELLALDVSGTSVSALPADYSTLRKLAVLKMNNIQGAPGLTAVPPGLATIPSLLELELANNTLGAAPVDVTTLASLQVLDLSGTALAAPPATPPSLQELYLQNNVLAQAPDLSGAQNLRIVDLSNNPIAGDGSALRFPASLRVLKLARTQLTGVPATLTAGGITKIDLSYAPIKALPDAFFHANMALQELDLSGLDMASLPSTIGLAKQLLVLEIDNFAPTRLATLPDTIGDLSSLRILRIQNQALGTASAATTAQPGAASLLAPIARLNNLRLLDLTGNNLRAADLPNLGTLTQLREFHISGNKLGLFPSGITKLPTMQKIIARDCEMSGELPNLALLPQLTHVDLSRNFFYGSLPEALLLTAPGLVSLNVNENALSGPVPIIPQGQKERLSTGLLLGENQFLCSETATEIGLAECNQRPTIAAGGVSPLRACPYATTEVRITLTQAPKALPLRLREDQHKCRVGSIVVPAVVDTADPRVVICQIPPGNSRDVPVSYANWGSDFSDSESEFRLEYSEVVCDPFASGAASGTLRALVVLLVLVLIAFVFVSLAACNLYFKKKKMEADSKSYRLLNEQM